MRGYSSKEKIEKLIEALGKAAKGPGRVYLVGGSSAVLIGWRGSTIDVDLKLDPEPKGIFEAISRLKNELDTNIELSSPDQFIPELPGWRDRSEFICDVDSVTFYHYDFYSQALAKLERGHEKDIADVKAMVSAEKISPDRVLEMFENIADELIRYPAIDVSVFRKRVELFAKAR